MLQSGVFKNLKYIITNASLSLLKHRGRGVIVWGTFLAATIGELLHCEKSFVEYILQK